MDCTYIENGGRIETWEGADDPQNVSMTNLLPTTEEQPPGKKEACFYASFLMIWESICIRIRLNNTYTTLNIWGVNTSFLFLVKVLYLNFCLRFSPLTTQTWPKLVVCYILRVMSPPKGRGKVVFSIRWGWISYFKWLNL